MKHRFRLDFSQWAGQVDALARVHLACSWADLCGDMDPLMRAYEYGQSPEQFVRWWADKYELEWFDKEGG